jgi:hypothetical protein
MKEVRIQRVKNQVSKSMSQGLVKMPLMIILWMMILKMNKLLFKSSKRKVIKKWLMKLRILQEL